MSSLAGLVAMVTGGGSGIGRAVALALAEQGVRIALVGRRREPLEAVAETIGKNQGLAWVLPADLAEEAQIRRLIEAFEQVSPRLDLLIHAAAMVRLGAMAEAPARDFVDQFRTNLLGPYVLTQGVLGLIRAARGQVVFINSSAGLNASARGGAYAATKHGLKAIADSLREEVNGDGVRVLSVYPGRTATPTQEAVHAWEGRSYRPELLLQPEDVASIIVPALALPRTAEVTDIRIRPLIKSY
jgi:NADP-dependent 3-hydroxy acid dehydrogenase YdfG